MDFRFTEKQEALRREIAEFAKKELPPDWLSFDSFGDTTDWAFVMYLAKKLGKKGWLVRHWPKEYGGGGASAFEKLIFGDEIAYWGIPGTKMGASGTAWVGPSIILFGTEEQKAKYLPPIAEGEPDGIWCTGYSEPDAGTDLAVVKTRAARDGDDYVINGMKVWQSMAHHARWCWLLVRTHPDLPRHKGLSIIIVDMESPGITVRPIIDFRGAHMLNEIFFDDVRVPATNLVGEENGGWNVVMGALNIERTAGACTGDSKRILEELVNYAKGAQQDGKPLSKNPLVRNRLANIAVEIEAVRLLAYKIAWTETKGQISPVDASVAKVLGTESRQRLVTAGMEILGPASQLRPASKRAKLRGALIDMQFMSFIGRFGGGTNEIQRNIIAWMGLGLPKA